MFAAAVPYIVTGALEIAVVPAAYLFALGPLALKILGPKVFKGGLCSVGPNAVTAAVMFVLSVYAITWWRHGSDLEQALGYWHNGMLIVALLYVMVLAWRRAPFTQVAPLLLVAVLSYFGAIYAPHDLAQKTYALLQMSTIAVLAFIGFIMVPATDLMGRLQWGILALGEGTSALQIVDCQFLHGKMYQSFDEGGACTNVYGLEIVSWLPVIMLTLISIAIWYRWFKPKGS